MGLHAIGDRRAALRGLPHPGRQHARRAGRRASGRSSRPSTAAGSRSARWPSVWPRRRSTRRSRTPGAQAVRPADRHLPGRRLHDRRHGDRDRGRAGDGLAGGVAQGPGPRLRPGRGAGQAVRLRGQLARDERRDPGPRRLRLRRGVQGRALPARRQAHRDRRGDEPDPAARDRPPDPRACGWSERAVRRIRRQPSW